MVSNQVQLVRCLLACGQDAIVNHQILPPGGGFGICKRAQRNCVHPLMGKSGSYPEATLNFLGFSLVLHPCPSLMNNCLKLPIRTQGSPWSLLEPCFPLLKNWRRGLPSWSSGWDHMVPSRGPRFDPLSGNRSHMLQPSAAKLINIKKKKKRGEDTKTVCPGAPQGPAPR